MKHETLDVRGQLCPIPVIRTQNTIKNLDHDDTLTVLCTDPGSLHDIPAWTRIHGHEVVDTKQTEKEIEITIKIKRRSE
jgi:tRNA 2-thiouridine synthesizing protein A